jgi:protein involved in polysaccharide export with SLBB domain
MNTTVKTAFGLLVTVGLCAPGPGVGQVRSPTGFEAQGQTQSQTPTRIPTQEQLRMLQQLPENQRRELMQALGITDLDLQRMGQQELQFPETVRPPLPEIEEEEWPPKLEAGSTVIVKLQLPRLTDPAEGFQQQQQQQQPQQQQPRTQRPIRVDPSRRPTDEDLQELQDFSRLETQGDVDPELERRFQERVERHPQLGRVRGAITYVLDRQGRINFPGIATIPLAGLTEYQAARRIEAEPNLRPLVAEVLLLPLEEFGIDALEPFGYELFEGTPVTFAPATDVPVPPDYVIGPGDEVRVQLFGQQNAIHSLIVSRDGSVNFPQIGPVVVAGLGFREMRELLQQRVSEQMIGVNASITMGELRSIRVFVLGDVTRPGSFTVSGLSTMTNALFVSGGIAASGSMRNVQLKRRGETVQRLDLYDLLLNGDNSNDARLQPNDVLFVPPRGPTVAVAGEVQRPAIYEIVGERNLNDVVRLAGGLLPTAYSTAARVERVDQTGGRSVHSYDLGTERERQAGIRGGDHVTISRIPDDVLTDHVTLSGHVRRPGPYQWRPGMRLTGLIGSVNDLQPDADRRYVLIRRQPDLSGPIELLSADLAAALDDPGGPEDPVLHNLDTATVFDLGSGRISVIGPLLRQLRMQAVYGRPAREVEVGGMVRAPGMYPLEEGMRVSDLIRAGASLTDSAYGLTAEITRYEVEDGSRRVVDLREVDLAAVLAGDSEADVLLQPFDYLNVQQVSQWRRRGSVALEGEVKFPGTYPIEPGETLSSVIARAGGLTDLAFPEGSIFLREDLREREREQIDRLITRLEADLATMALQSGRAAAIQGERVDQSLAVGQSLLGQLRRAEPVGRLVIDLPGAAEGREELDVVLRNGDRLLVPERRQEVMVLGEVQYATSHLFRAGLRRDDYVAASGGFTINADGDRTYVVRANGAVIAGDESSKWFRRSTSTDMRPGDTIVVPLDVDRVPALALWQSSTTILYNLAIAVAALGSL